MENGNIRGYLRKNPEADRVRLLSEVASGTLHLVRYQRPVLIICRRGILTWKRDHSRWSVRCKLRLGSVERFRTCFPPPEKYFDTSRRQSHCLWVWSVWIFERALIHLMCLFLSNVECIIYSRTYLVLDGLLQNGSHLPASLPQLRKQISGRLDYSVSKFLREKILTTIFLTCIYLFCWAKADTQSTLGPRQLVLVQRCGTFCNYAGKASGKRVFASENRRDLAIVIVI